MKTLTKNFFRIAFASLLLIATMLSFSACSLFNKVTKEDHAEVFGAVATHFANNFDILVNQSSSSIKVANLKATDMETVDEDYVAMQTGESSLELKWIWLGAKILEAVNKSDSHKKDACFSGDVSGDAISIKGQSINKKKIIYGVVLLSDAEYIEYKVTYDFKESSIKEYKVGFYRSRIEGEDNNAIIRFTPQKQFEMFNNVSKRQEVLNNLTFECNEFKAKTVKESNYNFTEIVNSLF